MKRVPKSPRNSASRRPAVGSSPATALSIAISAALGLFASVGTAEAGDILRGGVAAGAMPGKASANVTVSGTTQAASNAKDQLARNTQALQSVQAMQAAARQAALAGANSVSKKLPAVPNGLVPGGLQVAAGVPVNLAKPAPGENPNLWQGASLPTQTVSHGQTVVTIAQKQSTAILDWQTFNVGKKTTVDFDQSAGGSNASKWIAFNEINDPSGVPSQILGSIQAQGQVYLINQNGIIFGGSSQINLHALVASSLPIDGNLVSRGLLNNPDGQFLFSAIAQPQGSNGTPAFTPLVSDPSFTVTAAAPTYTLRQVVAANTTPTISAISSSFTPITLVAGTDYTLGTASGKTTITFTASGLANVAGANITVSYSSASIRYGDVVVQAGAQITSPSSSAHVGGRVALIGPKVINAGTINTPNGQTILAAGLQVGFTAHPSSDPTLRGLDVYVGDVADPSSILKPYAGTATNMGLIEAPSADVTIAGKNVQQFGFVDSSTSVTLNGRIDLLANYNATSNAANTTQSSRADTNVAIPLFVPNAAGTVTLGSNSVTQILPDVSDTATVVGTQLALPSLVNIQGRAIHLETNSTLLAPNASVPALVTGTSNFAVDVAGAELTAGISLTAGEWKPGQYQTQLVGTSGQIYLDSGAVIDASGSTNVPAPIEQNIISVQLLGTQLADSPLQRAGVLRGQTIEVDLRQTGVYNGFSWVGTPLADASGYLGIIQRDVGQLTVAGGTVNFTAGNSVVMQSGSEVNVSGGSIAYQGGMIQTTRLVSNGQLVDISQATPNVNYQGIYTGTFTTSYPKYSLADTFTNPLLLSGAHFEAGYTQGGNGGSITITAPSMALDGTLLGQTTPGPQQRALTSAALGGARPTPASLTLQFQGVRVDPYNKNEYIPDSPTPPEIVFESGADQTAADPFGENSSGNPLSLRKDRKTLVALSPDLVTKGGFGSLTVNDIDGNIIVPANVSITAQAGSSITLYGANIDVEGKLSAPGGALTFQTMDISPYVNFFYNSGATPTAVPGPNPSRGNFTLGSTGVLSTAGLIADDRASAANPGSVPLVTNGGFVTIKSFSAQFLSGSTIDVSGGVAISASNKRTYGQGGLIDIEAGLDQSPFNLPVSDQGLIGGSLTLQSNLLGYSGVHGGTLTIQAPTFQIGGTSDDPNTILLDPAFFSTGGFAAFNLIGLGASTKSSSTGKFIPGIFIAPGTVIDPVVENAVVMSDADDGQNVSLVPTLLPEAQRTPVSLSFATKLTDDPTNKLELRGDFVMGAGSIIQTDPLGAVSISSKGTATVLGSIFAPGGTISIAGASSSAGLGFKDTTDPLPTVELGPNAVLSTAGTVVLTPDARGFTTGTVLPGGAISISGNIVAEAGAVLDVSGTTATLDMRPQFSVVSSNSSTSQPASLTGSFLGFPLVPTQVDSNAGSIALKGSQELFTDATLVGTAGGPTAEGGSLSVSSGIFIAPSKPAQTPLDPTLVVTQSGPTVPASISGQSLFSTPLRGANGKVLPGLGHIAVDSFSSGGFGMISLLGTVEFDGPVSLSASQQLTIAANPASTDASTNGGVIYANSSVKLSAPYVQIGLPFQPPGFSVTLNSRKPSFGPGSLDVSGSLIDVGTLTLENIGNVSLTAANGDIRGDGTLDVQGHITLQAGQIYPPTGETFTIAAYDWTAGGHTQAGSVTILASGSRELPMSAGGTLNVYGTDITQAGVLRAPFGTINIGWDGSGTAPVDPLVGNLLPLATTKRVTLAEGSITSVSAVDPSTGEGITIPYGLNLNGTSWISPAGLDITSNGGVPQKTVNISGVNVVDQGGSIVDLRGGGDLFSYRFVEGTGGTNDVTGAGAAWSNSQNYNPGDLVSFAGQTWSARQSNRNVTPGVGPNWNLVSQSYAVTPGNQAGFAPYAPYNSANNQFLGPDAGYVSNSLTTGDQIYLNGSPGLSAGVYTLLPARYALLPGAFLITVAAGTPMGSQSLPDGSTMVSGYRFNGFNSTFSGQPVLTSFQVDSPSVVQSLASYDTYSANSFLYQAAVSHGVAIPRLPMDGGQLVLQAVQSLALRGIVQAQAPVGGQPGLVDISSPSDILISNSFAPKAGELVLNSAELSSFGAGSLLIGGIRSFGPDGTTVTVQTSKLTVDNAGSPLTGPDIILVASKDLTLAPGAEVEASGSLGSAAEPLTLGNSATPGSGDGTLLRVSTDPVAPTSRVGVDSAAGPLLTIGAGARVTGASARVTGASVTLDSTAATSLDPHAVIKGGYVNVDSGQISIELNNPGTLQTTTGLVLGGAALQTLESNAESLALSSYTSIDIYGTGQIGDPTVGILSLNAAEIRSFNNGGGTASIAAREIVLGNSINGAAPGAIGAPTGTLAFKANTILLGSHQIAIDQVVTVSLDASVGVGFRGTGDLVTQGDLTIATPVITGGQQASETITAGGGIEITGGSAIASRAGGIGASLALVSGANSSFISPSGLSGIVEDSDIVLPGGLVSLEAKTGDVDVGGQIDATGAAVQFSSGVQYTDGGTIKLASDSGSVAVTGTISVSSVGGNAGSLSISTPDGAFSIDPKAKISGSGGEGGSFSLDAGSLPSGSVASLNTVLDKGGFVQSISIRDRSDSSVVIDGSVTAHTFELSADAGSIEVTSGTTIDASGSTGGSITLQAAGSLTLDSGSTLTVEATDGFNSAGKGGSVTLAAGAYVNGTIDTNATLAINQGSQIILSVEKPSSGKSGLVDLSSDPTVGHFTGTLLLEAPQISGSNGPDLQVSEIDGKIIDASSVVVAGTQVFNLTSTTGGTTTNGAITTVASGGTINSTVTSAVNSNATAFTNNTVNITNRLLQNYTTNTGLTAPTLVIEPGAELVDTTGNLTLSTDWDLHTFRFGPNGAPGILTLRAAGNLVFNATLSDGFSSSKDTATLLGQNSLLPTNVQSWSYNLTAGADFSGANVSNVQSLASLQALQPNTDFGSLQLGVYGIGAPGGTISQPRTGASAVTSDNLVGHYQVIRTGTGDINVAAGENVEFHNQFATIYTAGVQIAEQVVSTNGGITTIASPGGLFDVPVDKATVQSAKVGQLGVIQNLWQPQYSLAGGNVSITAGQDILHQALSNGTTGTVIADSEKELPMNWLYRRGYVSSTGVFATTPTFGEVASTSWWVDFSNFFEGVGALGGGNVVLSAGRDVVNVDAVAPTNALMAGKDSQGNAIAPNAANLLELGGGNVTVRAGHDINGGVYYVERGAGVLSAGDQITTNSTRTVEVPAFQSAGIADPNTWLPTTLFLGDGSFNVSARGDVLLGPVANPFLLPAGINDIFLDKTYFSTYSPQGSVNVSSLGGTVTLREQTTDQRVGSNGILQDWLQDVLLFNSLSTTATVSSTQPWLRLDESNVASFVTPASLLPSNLSVTAFSGDIRIIGNLTLAPASRGTLSLSASGSLNGFSEVGLGVGSVPLFQAATIDISDANPELIPSPVNPEGYASIAGANPSVMLNSGVNPFSTLQLMLAESGSALGAKGVLQTQQALHGQTLLHAGDSNPVVLEAQSGDISGLTLFSPKAAHVTAGQDITDVALFLQNDNPTDVSVVSAGRDITAYDPGSPLRSAAEALLGSATPPTPQSGDIQISGPGTLEVFAGRNIDLGQGRNSDDAADLDVGVASIGNARNPNLPFGGADVVVGAGIGPSTGGSIGALDFATFITQFVKSASGARYFSELNDVAGQALGTNAKITQASFDQLPTSEQDLVALDIFYLALRDAGRDHADSTSTGFNNYDAGLAAIAALFPKPETGDISLSSRNVVTESGGNISLFAPGGELSLGNIIESPPPGVVTQDGGDISIFTKGNVDVGVERIFTLRGGNEIIWSSDGNIAAGASSKTVATAPPTRVLVDAQSGDVDTDLAGLATGGGIGVLASVEGVPPGNVDLIAPTGSVDAGDAGIRVTGNLTIAAVQVLNAGNIQVGGSSTGTPVSAPPAAPNIGAISAAQNGGNVGNNAAQQVAKQGPAPAPAEEPPSVVTVEVVGYGGGDDSGDTSN